MQNVGGMYYNPYIYQPGYPQMNSPYYPVCPPRTVIPQVPAPVQNSQDVKLEQQMNTQGQVNRSNLEANIPTISDCDGEIKDFKQGFAGDCWFLSGIKALSATSSGKKYIKDSIVKNSDGSFTVNFKGVGKSYVISPKEFQDARNMVEGDKGLDGTSGIFIHKYSTGDPDALLLELAMKKYRTDLVNNKIDLSSMPNYAGAFVCKNNPEDGGPAAQVFYMLTGKQSGTISTTGLQIPDKNETLCPANGEKLSEFLDKYISNNDDYAVGFNVKSDVTVKDISGKDVFLSAKHMFAFEKADANTITITNPKDTSNKITLSLDTFKNVVKTLEYVNLKDDNDPFDEELKKYSVKHTETENYINKNY